MLQARKEGTVAEEEEFDALWCRLLLDNSCCAFLQRYLQHFPRSVLNVHFQWWQKVANQSTKGLCGRNAFDQILIKIKTVASCRLQSWTKRNVFYSKFCQIIRLILINIWRKLSVLIDLILRAYQIFYVLLFKTSKSLH